MDLQKAGSSCCLCFPMSATTLKYILWSPLVAVLQCAVLGRENTPRAGKELCGSEAYLLSKCEFELSFPAFSGIFQEMLAAYQNIKYKGSNFEVLSVYIRRDKEFSWLSCCSLAQLSRKIKWSSSFLVSSDTWKGETKEFPIGDKLKETLWVSSVPSYQTVYLSFYCCHLSSYSFSCHVHCMGVVTEQNLFFTFLVPGNCEMLLVLVWWTWLYSSILSLIFQNVSVSSYLSFLSLNLSLIFQNVSVSSYSFFTFYIKYKTLVIYAS